MSALRRRLEPHDAFVATGREIDLFLDAIVPRRVHGDAVQTMRHGDPPPRDGPPAPDDAIVDAHGGVRRLDAEEQERVRGRPRRGPRHASEGCRQERHEEEPKHGATIHAVAAPTKDRAAHGPESKKANPEGLAFFTCRGERI